MEASSYRLISLHHILLSQTFTKASENYPLALQTGFTLRTRLRCPGPRSPLSHALNGKDVPAAPGGSSQTCSLNSSGLKTCTLPRRGSRPGFPHAPLRSLRGPAPPPPPLRPSPSRRSGDSHRPGVQACKAAARAVVKTGWTFPLTGEDAGSAACPAVQLEGGMPCPCTVEQEHTAHSVVIPARIALIVGRLHIIN